MGPWNRRAVCVPVVLSTFALLLVAAGPSATAHPTATAARAAAPVVTKLDVSRGPSQGGTRVTITGLHFVDVRRVMFGATKGSALHVESASKLKVTAPTHSAGRIDVRVVTKAGTSAAVTSDRFLFFGWSRTQLPFPNDVGVDQRHTALTTCWAVGHCAGAGGYTNKAGDWVAVLWTLSGHTWTPTKAPLPANAADDPFTQPQQIVCGSSGVCAVPAIYTSHIGGSDRTDINLMWILDGGKWEVQNLPLPSDADGGYVTINGVACAARKCVAEGAYSNPDSGGAVLWTYAGNSWKQVAAPLPGDAAADPFQEIDSIACEPSGTCAGAGTYSNGVQTEGAFWRLTPGGWVVSKVKLPSFASEVSTNQSNASMTCGAAGECAAKLAVNYGQQSFTTFALWTLSGQTWSVANLPLPHGADTQYVPRVTTVSCAKSGVCAAGGSYTDLSGDSQGVLWQRIGQGTWKATKAPLPPDAADNPNPNIAQVSCTAAGVCVAAGNYYYHLGGVTFNQDAIAWVYSGGAWSRVPPFAKRYEDQLFQAMSCSDDYCAVLVYDDNVSTHWKLFTLSHGVWRGYRTAVPPGANPGIVMSTVDCGAGDGCAATGYYEDHSFNKQFGSWVYVE